MSQTLGICQVVKEAKREDKLHNEGFDWSSNIWKPLFGLTLMGVSKSSTKVWKVEQNLDRFKLVEKMLRWVVKCLQRSRRI